MKTIAEVLPLTLDYLKTKAPTVRRVDTEELIAHCIGSKRLGLYMAFERPLDEVELEKIRSGIKRLVAGEPVEYIIGSVEFGGCTITVDRRVLIPRPETELLVEHVLTSIQNEPIRVLDLCTGSGCIGLAVKRGVAVADVILSDISEDALQVARQNAERNGLDVTFLQSDLLAKVNEQIDVLICNPPYIATHEFPTLDPSVRDFEPRLALEAGPTGLEFYTRLAYAAKDLVRKAIWLEIGSAQGSLVKDIFQNAGYSKIEIHKDLASHDRFVSIRI